MPALRQWRERPNWQPERRIRLDFSNKFARDMIFACYMTPDDAVRPPYNYIQNPLTVGTGGASTSSNVGQTGTTGTYGNASQWHTYNASTDNTYNGYYSGRIANAPKFNGSTSIAFCPLDLSPFNHLTMAFWARRETAEVGKIGIEYTVGQGGGRSGWYFSVNAVDNSTSNTSAEWGRYSGGLTATICGSGTQPPAVGVWHHYIMQMQQTSVSWGGDGVTQGTSVDGLKGNFVGSGNAILAGLDANGGLFFGARSGLVAPSNISICGFQMWNRHLSYTEAQEFYGKGTWQAWNPIPSTFYSLPYIQDVSPPPGSGGNGGGFARGQGNWIGTDILSSSLTNNNGTLL